MTTTVGEAGENPDRLLLVEERGSISALLVSISPLGRAPSLPSGAADLSAMSNRFVREHQSGDLLEPAAFSLPVPNWWSQEEWFEASFTSNSLKLIIVPVYTGQETLPRAALSCSRGAKFLAS
jgi:hypothetical protein